MYWIYDKAEFPGVSEYHHLGTVLCQKQESIFDMIYGSESPLREVSQVCEKWSVCFPLIGVEEEIAFLPISPRMALSPTKQTQRNIRQTAWICQYVKTLFLKICNSWARCFLIGIFFSSGI